MCSSDLTMAKAECACWFAHACLFTKDGACVLGKGKRCAYFEESVLPLGLPRYYPEKYANTRRLYLKTHKMSADEEENRRCECGALLAHGKRLCETCRKRRKREVRLAAYHKSKTGQLGKNGNSQGVGAQ